jgi:ubiquinone/menaquinone biosynthesis C-methylase UbiE
MEFAVTMLTLRNYLPRPPAKILDVGGGPGKYAIALAKCGYAVTLVDLSETCLEFAKLRAKEAEVELVDYVRANATSLKMFSPNSYDAFLLMGPLYHLLSGEQRRRSVLEARRLLRHGGVIFASFITRYAPIRYVAKHDPRKLIERHRRYDRLLKSGVLRAHGEGHFTDAYFCHSHEIQPLMQRGGFTTMDIIACEGVTSMIDEKINVLTDEAWETWVETNYQLGRDQAIHGAAEHLLYVGRKSRR